MSNEEEQILNIKVKYEDAINGIIEYKKRIGELKDMQEQLKEELKEGKITTEEYNRSIVAIDEQVKDYKKTTQELSKEVQNNIKKQKEAEGSLRSLRAELSNATKEYDALSKKEREGAKGQAMKKHINEITAALKEAEEGTQRFYRNVGNYENAIKNALGVNNNFANSILNMAQSGGGVKGMFTEATTSAKAFGTTLMGFMTNPVFLALAGIAGVGVAFKWFYDYNKGIAESTRLTKEFLGLTGDELKAVRDSIQATADTYGKDYKETLEGVDVLMSNFGMTAQEALKVINDGFQAGADLNGNMIDQIKQYGGAFHDAGIGASELVGYIQQTRSGIFSEQGMNLIQTASTKLRTMASGTASALDAVGISSKKLQEDIASGQLSMSDAIKKIAGRIKEIGPNTQEAANIITNVFGKQGAAAGQEMIKALEDLNTDLDTLKDTTGEYGKALDESRQASEELNNTVAALFDMSDKGFGELGTQIKTIATKWLTQLLQGLIKVINYVIDLYNETTVFRGVIQGLVLNFKLLWNAVKLAFNLIIDQVKSAGRALKGFATILEGIFTFNVDKIKKGFVDLTNNAVATVKETFGDVKKFAVDGAKDTLDAVNKTIKNKKIEHITIPTVAEGVDSGSTGGTSQSGGSGSSGKGNGSGGKSGKNNTPKIDAAAQAKKEAEEIRKAEDLLMQLVVQTNENLRKALEVQYDRQIEDLRKRLETEKNLTVTMKTAINAQISALEEIKGKKLAEFDIKVREEEIKREETFIRMKLESVKKGSDEELSLKLTSIMNQQQLEIDALEKSVLTEEEKQQAIALIRQKYEHQEEEEIKAHNNALMEAQTKAIQDRYKEQILQTQIESQGTDELGVLRLQMEEKQALLEEAQQREGESIEAFNQRKLQLDWDYQQAKQQVTEKEIEVEKAKYESVTGVMGSLASVAEAFGEQNAELAKASKVIALGEIAVNSGVALAQGIKQAQSVPYPANLAAIASTVATILSNIASATKTVKSAKFATGGLVTGPGTGTSDSISAQLSNGESVMTARATKMFAPALSAFNQIGGGVPISTGTSGSQAIGEEFLASAVARGMAMAPRPVVSVEEINNTASRVETIERLATIG